MISIMSFSKNCIETQQFFLVAREQKNIWQIHKERA